MNVFLDTNIFIHYNDFEQIDFCTLLGADTVKIVIPPVVIRELNKQKESNLKEKIRKRAGSCSKRLLDLFESESEIRLPNGNIVRLEDRDPIINFEELGLRQDIQDDNLLASIIQWKREFPESVIVLVTSDAGLILLGKARRLGIKPIKLSDSFKLPADLHADEKRMRQLENEIRELKLRAPKLLLTFDDARQYKEFLLPTPLEATNEYVQTRLDEIREGHPKMQVEPKQVHRTDIARHVPSLEDLAAATAFVSPFDRVMPEQIEKYNHELDRFYEEYATHVQNQAIFHNLRQRTIELPFCLTNVGTTPAEDIDVQLHFPDGIDLTNLRDFPKAPSAPKPPEVPSPPLTAFGSSLQKLKEDWGKGLNLPYMTSQTSMRLPRNVSSPKIRRTNSYDVTVHVSRLKHTFSEDLDRMCATFDSYDAAASFRIDYGILASNLPNEITGTLHVKINR